MGSKRIIVVFVVTVVDGLCGLHQQVLEFVDGQPSPQLLHGQFLGHAAGAGPATGTALAISLLVGPAKAKRIVVLAEKLDAGVMERIEEIPYLLIKKDGRREAFDRQKLAAGLQRACEKRPVAAKAINDLLLTLLFRADLSHRLRELVILRIGWVSQVALDDALQCRDDTRCDVGSPTDVEMPLQPAVCAAAKQIPQRSGLRIDLAIEIPAGVRPFPYARW